MFHTIIHRDFTFCNISIEPQEIYTKNDLQIVDTLHNTKIQFKNSIIYDK